MQPSPLQPRLKANAPINPGAKGEWHYRENPAFYAELADSLELDIGIETRDEIVSHIPDMWARPLLVEMVLSNTEHPLHQKIKAQWRGMLSAIALGEVYRLKLAAVKVDLNTPGDSFLGALRSLIPDRQKTVYQTPGNPWTEIYVFTWESNPVGMTSPLTLICPSEEGDWRGLPWYQEGQLKSPLPWYLEDGSISPLTCDELTNDDKIQLKLWLGQLYAELTINNAYSARLRELILEFQQELTQNLTSNITNPQRRHCNNQQYFQIPLLLGAIATLNNPIGAKSAVLEESSLLLTQTNSGQVLFIPKDWEDLCRVWRQNKRDIWVYDSSIAAFNLTEFKNNYGGDYLTYDDIFLPEFYFLKGSQSFLPGAILPQGATTITYRDKNRDIAITPLLPLNPKILDYFTPETLNEIIEIRPQNRQDNRYGIVITLKLKLTGGEYSISKDYEIKPSQAITSIPFLEIWPNFRAEGWQEYYAFYFDDRTAAQKQQEPIFTVNFNHISQIHAPEGQNFQITRLNQFPSYILCQDSNSTTTLGLIFLQTPPRVGNLNPNETWQIGIDFGTSFTNVYYNPSQTPEKLSFSPIHLQVTAIPSGRLAILYKYFMSGALEKFPLSTVLTTLGATGIDKTIFDGRVYIPQNLNQFNPTENYLKTDLKWSLPNLAYNKLFLKHLALLITAEAASQQVKKIEWAVSFPSAFSLDDKNTYYTTWTKIVQELNITTGMEHKWRGNLNQHFRTEALALAQYFADYEDHDLLYTTCIDMGGGTSDISIWQSNHLIHQCSIQLAGRDLFAQFMRQKISFIEEQFDVNLTEVASQIQPEPFYVTLEAVLLTRGEEWLKNHRPNLINSRDLDYVIQLTTLGISGLYYYIGKIIAGLYQEGKYLRQENTPVYIGGNGSRILNWLSPSGEFNSFCEAGRLFSRMLQGGSQFSDRQESTILSQKPKDEVACGLVYSKTTRLRGLTEPETDQVFAAEACTINGEQLSDSSRLILPPTIDSFVIDDISNLKDFVDKYHQALADLNLKGIKPIPDYQNQQAQIWRQVKRRVDNALIQMTGNSQKIRPQPTFILGLKELLKILNTGDNQTPDDDD